MDGKREREREKERGKRKGREEKETWMGKRRRDRGNHLRLNRKDDTNSHHEHEPWEHKISYSKSVPGCMLHKVVFT